jgi:formate hydrogenlyase transcriptional activator
LGSARTIHVDVRIVAATNCDLSRMVEERKFRADLFYRLHVFPIALPPLRDRLDDIPQLVWHFVRQFADRMNKQIDIVPDETMDAMARYTWPGNIRELQNFIERAVILSGGRVLCAPLGDLRGVTETAAPTSNGTLADAERAHILGVLRQVDWQVGGRGGAAVRLGLPRTTLLHRMHKLGIVPTDLRHSAC